MLDLIQCRERRVQLVPLQVPFMSDQCIYHIIQWFHAALLKLIKLILLLLSQIAESSLMVTTEALLDPNYVFLRVQVYNSPMPDPRFKDFNFLADSLQVGGSFEKRCFKDSLLLVFVLDRLHHLHHGIDKLMMRFLLILVLVFQLSDKALSLLLFLFQVIDLFNNLLLKMQNILRK